jgi:predicted NAD/FAD-dependent oxidoreductase
MLLITRRDISTPVEFPVKQGSSIREQRLFFAGEHTYGEASGTVHGAWESGKRASSEILHALRQSKIITQSLQK